MRRLIPLGLAVLLVVGVESADETVIKDFAVEDFTMQPETRWWFFADQVMGGVSTGGVIFAQKDGQPYARMTGRVSTANRGGFMQMQLGLASPPLEGTTGVRLVIRGNIQRHFGHLRTGGALLRSVARPRSLTSVAVIA